MEFDWNPAKCAKNITERGIDFADVVVAFGDPAKKVARDERNDYGEERFNMLAKVNGRVFHLTFTERGKVTWIISARKANQREQRRYEKS
ncbi:MAG: BrnT family toxin [Bradyrhizobium sp.]